MKRRSVSIRGVSYARLLEIARSQGRSCADVVESVVAVTGLVDHPRETVPLRARRQVIAALARRAALERARAELEIGIRSPLRRSTIAF
jgi:hypothetical protein